MSAPVQGQRLDYTAADSIAVSIRQPWGGEFLQFTIHGDGSVTEHHRATRRITPRDLIRIEHALEFADFDAMPASMSNVSAYCRTWMSDQAHSTIAVFWPGHEHRVADDEGCVWAPAALRSVEQDIATVLNPAQTAANAAIGQDIPDSVMLVTGDARIVVRGAGKPTHFSRYREATLYLGIRMLAINPAACTPVPKENPATVLTLFRFAEDSGQRVTHNPGCADAEVLRDVERQLRMLADSAGGS
jgi:hypothetical protein